MQYLSPEGVPQQSSVQYIQLLRPVMMVPAQNYMPIKPKAEPVTEKPTTTSTAKPLSSKHWMNPYGPYSRQHPLIGSHVGSYSSPLTSYQPRPLPSQKPSSSLGLGFDFGLNMNEFLPSASALVSSFLSPRSSGSMSGSSISPQYAQFHPTKYQNFAQRA
jgi:hypothetical protein